MNYYTYQKKLRFKNLVQSEVLRLKQLEHSYFTLRFIDLSPATEDQMTLTT